MKIVNGKKMFSTSDLEDLLGVSRATITKLRKQGQLLSARLGRGLYTSEDSLNDYLNGKAIQAASRQKEQDKELSVSLRQLSEYLTTGTAPEGINNVDEFIETLRKENVIDVIPDPDGNGKKVVLTKEYLSIFTDKSRSASDPEK